MKKTPFSILLKAILVASCSLVTAIHSHAFTYPTFASTSGLNLVDSATQTGSLVQLTPASVNTSGAMWFGTKQPITGGFTTTFQFRMSNPGGAAGGGDGIAFALQNSSPTSSGWEFGALSNTVAVSFNTFDNFGDEPSDNFVGIATNGYSAVRYSKTFDLNPTAIRLKDGTIHTAELLYNASGLSVTLDGLAIINNAPLRLTDALDASGNAWVGFGARTGGAFEKQDIISWSFQPIPEPASGSLIGCGLLGGLLWKAWRRKQRSIG